MNYQEIYNRIIEKAKRESRVKSKGSYYETHHIVPKCLGGEGTEAQWKWHPNLVLLTAKEHYICHKLLCRIYPENHKLAFAFWHLCNQRNKFQTHRFIPSSRSYEEAKEKLAFLGISEETRQKIISTKATKSQKHSVETIEKIRATKAKNRYKPTEEAIKKGVETRRARGSYGHSKESAEKRKLTMLLRPYKHSEETLKKLKKPKKKIECPICQSLIAAHLADRYHFSNCKYKN